MQVTFRNGYTSRNLVIETFGHKPTCENPDCSNTISRHSKTRLCRSCNAMILHRKQRGVGNPGSVFSLILMHQIVNAVRKEIASEMKDVLYHPRNLFGLLWKPKH